MNKELEKKLLTIPQMHNKNDAEEVPIETKEQKQSLKDMAKEEIAKRETIDPDDEFIGIVDEALKEIEKGENVKDSDCDGKATLVDIKENIVDLKKQDHDSSIEILKETHYIKKAMAQHNKLTYSLVFVAGTAFGMSDSKWLPYASWIYEFGKEVILKGGN